METLRYISGSPVTRGAGWHMHQPQLRRLTAGKEGVENRYLQFEPNGDEIQINNEISKRSWGWPRKQVLEALKNGSAQSGKLTVRVDGDVTWLAGPSDQNLWCEFAVPQERLL